jgi:hypothetical protein
MEKNVMTSIYRTLCDHVQSLAGEINEKPNTQTILADVTFIKVLTVSKF